MWSLLAGDCRWGGRAGGGGEGDRKRQFLLIVLFCYFPDVTYSPRPGHCSTHPTPTTPGHGSPARLHSPAPQAPTPTSPAGAAHPLTPGAPGPARGGRAAVPGRSALGGWRPGLPLELTSVVPRPALASVPAGLSAQESSCPLPLRASDSPWTDRPTPPLPVPQPAQCWGQVETLSGEWRLGTEGLFSSPSRIAGPPPNPKGAQTGPV